MRRIALLTALLLGLAPAAAQVPLTLQDNSVYGRIGAGSSSGPAEAIPFATLAAKLGTGNVGGPGTSVVGDLATWNSLTGVKLADTTATAWLDAWCSSTQYNFPQRGASTWACSTVSSLLVAGAGITLSGTGQVTITCTTFGSGAKGCVPASGGGTSNFLRADGNWVTPAGSGNVSGPGSSVDQDIALWSGASGTNLIDSGLTMPGLVQGYLSGLTITNDNTGSNIANDIAVATGIVTDSTNVDMIKLASAISQKHINVAWAVGSNQGCLDTGAVGNNTYWIFLIKRTDTGVVDVLCSLSPSAPTLPASYTEQRRIGAVLRKSAANVLFTQVGNYFYLTVYGHDINNQNVGTTATTYTLASVPSGVVVRALGVACVFASSATSIANFYPIIVTDQTVAYGSFGNVRDSSAGSGSCANLDVLTNASAQIRARGSVAGATIDWNTIGWIDTRGQ